ncbi:MAG: 50S ribosomal protein L19 [Candidatus Omnitrophica bacterium]|nr:50S ribosomal protein L19 [Candidatus Omnitrophota bacterium]
MNIKIEELEKELMKKKIPNFKIGDTVRVFVKIKEGDKTRLQAFEGIVIARKNSGIRETFTVRRISYGEGVERIFQLHSPLVDSVDVVKRGKVRKSKLYYLRKKIGKHTKVEEARTAEQKEDAALGKEGVS